MNKNKNSNKIMIVMDDVRYISSVKNAERLGIPLATMLRMWLYERPELQVKLSKDVGNTSLIDNSINPATSRKYSPVMKAVLKVLTEANGKILLSEAARRLLSIVELKAKDPEKRAIQIFSETAIRKKPDGSFLYGVPTKITWTGSEKYVELIKKE